MYIHLLSSSLLTIVPSRAYFLARIHLVMFSTLNLISTCSILLLLTSLNAIQAGKLVTSSPQETETTSPQGGKKAKILQFPADWSRGAYPIGVHSHNDYWQNVPVLDALSYGVMSIETDVWLNPKDSELYVGHDPFSLTKERTFANLSIQPLMDALNQANSANSNYSDSEEADFFKELQEQVSTPKSNPWNGYFSLGVGNTASILLLVDVKTDGADTWPHVVRGLQPLREKGWLTKFQDGKIKNGPVTIIGTGNTPIEQVAPLDDRDVFFDCPLGSLDQPKVVNGTQYQFNENLCGVASVDFGSITTWNGVNDPSDQVRKNLTDAIDQAHSMGIKTRFWDTPEWPTFARDNVNRLLIELGSDYINADDLEAISKF